MITHGGGGFLTKSSRRGLGICNSAESCGVVTDVMIGRAFPKNIGAADAVDRPANKPKRTFLACIVATGLDDARVSRR